MYLQLCKPHGKAVNSVTSRSYCSWGKQQRGEECMKKSERQSAHIQLSAMYTEQPRTDRYNRLLTTCKSEGWLSVKGKGNKKQITVSLSHFLVPSIKCVIKWFNVKIILTKTPQSKHYYTLSSPLFNLHQAWATLYLGGIACAYLLLHRSFHILHV